MNHTYAQAITLIKHAFTGKLLKFGLQRIGFSKQPKCITDMYLRSESAEYIYAACLAVNQIGE